MSAKKSCDACGELAARLEKIEAILEKDPRYTNARHHAESERVAQHAHEVAARGPAALSTLDDNALAKLFAFASTARLAELLDGVTDERVLTQARLRNLNYTAALADLDVKRAEAAGLPMVWTLRLRAEERDLHRGARMEMTEDGLAELRAAGYRGGTSHRWDGNRAMEIVDVLSFGPGERSHVLTDACLQILCRRDRDPDLAQMIERGEVVKSPAPIEERRDAYRRTKRTEKK